MYFRLIHNSFERIGARVRIRNGPAPRQAGFRRPRFDGLVVDVRRDACGEYFDIVVDSMLIDVSVVDSRPQDALLLLAVRSLVSARGEQFLCGQDHNGWFVAALPAHSDVCDVRSALEALKAPLLV